MELYDHHLSTWFLFHTLFNNIIDVFSFSSLIFSLITIIIIFTIIIITTFFYCSISKKKKMKKNIFCNCEICKAYITSSWSKDFINLCDWYSHLLKNSPKKTIHIHVLKNTITANSQNVEYILKTNFENYPKGRNFSMILGDFLGKGIFNVDGELWRFQKKMASLELNNHSIRSFAFEIVNYEIQKRLIPLLSSPSSSSSSSSSSSKSNNQIDDGVVLDLQEIFRRFSFDTICRFSFGLDPKCLENSLPNNMSNNNFSLSFDLASKLSAERAMVVSPLVWKMKRFFNYGSEKKLKESIRVINLLAKEVIKQRRKFGFSNKRDLLSRFMSTIQNDDNFLRDIVISFLLAGRDTVASALTSFFWLLAKHPHVELEIRLEADKVIGAEKELTSYEELGKLHYLKAAVYESMRLYPPIQFDSKFCVEDDVLPDGTMVKSGTRVTYHPYAMGRLEYLWGQDCLEFKPQRWLKNGIFKPENPFKYPIFQAGLRVCMGKEMALMEIKSVVVSLVRRFKIRLVNNEDEDDDDENGTPRFSPGLTSTFSSGLPVMVSERE